MCREAKPNDQFVVSALNYWTQEHEEKLAELISVQLSKSGSAMKRKRYVIFYSLCNLFDFIINMIVKKCN